MDEKHQSHYLLYQNAELEVNMPDDTIFATTVLWIAYRTSVKIDDVVRLHCRQCTVLEVQINNVPCMFSHIDPLQTLTSDKKPNYLGDELDTLYRAALEISRAGELEITVPDVSSGHIDLPLPVPKDASREVRHRYHRLCSMYRKFSDLSKYGADYNVAEDVPTDGESGAAAQQQQQQRQRQLQCYLLQVKIKYEVHKSQSYFKGGCSFRRQPSFVELFEQTVNSLYKEDRSGETAASSTSGASYKLADSFRGDCNDDDSQSKQQQKQKHSSPSTAAAAAQCVYSVSAAAGANGGNLRDIDGVRCWLPSIDSLDQRLVFDICFKVPKAMHIVCSGKLISRLSLPIAATTGISGKTAAPVPMKLVRFYTPNRLPASAVGFFIGDVESYKMGLYKTRCRIWVATGLNDFNSASGDAEKAVAVAAAAAAAAAAAEGLMQRNEEVDAAAAELGQRKRAKTSNGAAAGDTSAAQMPPPEKKKLGVLNNSGNSKNSTYRNKNNGNIAGGDDALSATFSSHSHSPSTGKKRQRAYSDLSASEVVDGITSTTPLAVSGVSCVVGGGGDGGGGGRLRAYSDLSVTDIMDGNTAAGRSMAEGGGGGGEVGSSGSMDQSFDSGEGNGGVVAGSIAGGTLRGGISTANGGGKYSVQQTGRLAVDNGEEEDEDEDAEHDRLYAAALAYTLTQQQAVREEGGTGGTGGTGRGGGGRGSWTKNGMISSSVPLHVPPPRRRLYASKVLHSTLGLDMAVARLHKMLNQRYTHEEITIIYVHNLGQDFMAFDGFIMIDARFLHSEKEVYLETAAHMVLMTAYTYSWFLSCLYLSSYETEFIMHGCVGYLLNCCYAEDVFGEADAHYRYQKIYDSVIEFEKRGLGGAIATTFFPEDYRSFLPHFGRYQSCKSTVIFQIIENRVGSRKLVVELIKQLLRAPPLKVLKLPKGSGSSVGSNISPRELRQASAATNNGGQSSPLSPTSPSSPYSSSGVVVAGTGIESAIDMAAAMRQNGQHHFTHKLDHRYLRSLSAAASTGGGSGGGGTSPYGDDSSSIGNTSPVTPFGSNTSPSAMSGGGASSAVAGGAGNLSPYAQQYGGGSGNLSPYAAGEYTPRGGNMSPYSKAAAGGGGANQSPYHYQSMYSPTRQQLQQQQQQQGGGSHQSPYAASAGTGHLSPLSVMSTGGGPSSSGGGFPVLLNPGAPYAARGGGPVPVGLYRMHSNMSDDSSAPGGAWGENDFALIAEDSISLETFVLALRHVCSAGAASGAVDAMDQMFFDDLVFKSGVLFVRSNLGVSHKVENKPRQLIVVCEQIGLKKDADIPVSNTHCGIQPIPMRIVERRDDTTTEPILEVGKSTKQYVQVLYSRPGRKANAAGGRRKFTAEDIIADGAVDEFGEPLDMEAAQVLAQQQERLHEERKCALQRVREMDPPVKFALIDPKCHYILEARLQPSSADALLVEQLFADHYRHSVFFHCQALRSLAAGMVSVAKDANPLAEEVASNGAAATAAAAAAAAAAASIKSAKVQVRAMADCLLGTGGGDMLQQPDSKCLVGPHSPYIRGEAAFALAAWQNANAPRLVTADSASLSAARAAWLGLSALVHCVGELFVDPYTLHPLSVDFANEAATLLRCNALLAVSSVHTTLGVSPPAAVNIVLKFATAAGISGLSSKEYNNPTSTTYSNNSSSNSNNNDGDNTTTVLGGDGYDAWALGDLSNALDTTVSSSSSSINNNNSNSNSNSNTTSLYAPAASPPVRDGSECHYIACLFLALSRLHFDSIGPHLSSTAAKMTKTAGSSGEFSSSSGGSSSSRTGYIEKIASAAHEYCMQEYISARTEARLQYERHDVNPLPSLAGAGIHVAAAITCMSEMDVQAIHLYGKGIARVPELYLNNPTGVGIVSRLNYLSYFLSPAVSASVRCTIPSTTTNSSSSSTSSGGNTNKTVHTTIKDEMHFYLASRFVRAAAFEGFVRQCFALHIVHTERHRAQHASASASVNSSNSSSSSSASSAESSNAIQFIAAAFEALNKVLQNDPDPWVMEQAAQSVHDAMIGVPPRVAAAALSCSNYAMCADWSDPEARTLIACTGLQRGSQYVPTSGGAAASSGAVTSSGINKNGSSISSSSAGESSNNASIFKSVLDYRLAMKGTGMSMRIVAKVLWRIINSQTAFSQPTRSILLSSWLYCFKYTKPPRVLAPKEETETSFTDWLFESSLQKDRFNLFLRNPIETVEEINTKLKKGSKAVVTSLPARGNAPPPRVPKNRNITNSNNSNNNNALDKGNAAAPGSSIPTSTGLSLKLSTASSSAALNSGGNNVGGTGGRGGGLKITLSSANFRK